jgi:hypothetical protein
VQTRREDFDSHRPFMVIDFKFKFLCSDKQRAVLLLLLGGFCIVVVNIYNYPKQQHVDCMQNWQQS